MKEINIDTRFTVFESLDELPQEARELMTRAIEARKKAYAPYSNFQVGAAVLMDNEQIIAGSNQENAAYPSGLCAERVAVYHAAATYPENRFLKIAISAASLKHLTSYPISPCGACRQSLAEYECKQDHPIEVYFMGESGQIFQSPSITNLLPLCFNQKSL